MADEDKFERLKPKPVANPEQPPLHISGKTRPTGNVQTKEGPIQKLGRTLSDLQRSVQALTRTAGPAPERPVSVAQAALQAVKTQERVIEKHTHLATEKHTHEQHHTESAGTRLAHDSRIFSHVRQLGEAKPADVRGASISAPVRAGVRHEANGSAGVAGSAYQPASAGTASRVPGRPVVRTPASVVNNQHTSIRMPAVSVPRTTTRQHVSGRRRGSAAGYQVVTGADAEARRQIIDQDDTSVGALPSAARLAHILRADELGRDGTGEPSEFISTLAAAIRAGDRRAVADVDPVKVQDAIHTSLGGATRAAQLLNTPETTRMIERYQSMVSVVRENMHNTEKQIERSNVAGIASSPRRPARVTQTEQPVRAAATPMAGSYPRLGANSGTPAQDSSRALETMLSTNEEPHAIAAGEAAQQEMRLASREGSSVTRMTAPKMTAPERTADKAPPLERGRTVGSSITTAPSAPVKISTDSPTNKNGKGGRMRIDGKLMITGPGGQALGEARMDADMRGQ